MLAKSKFKPIAVLACMILVILALFCIGNTEADAATYSGTCGTNVLWSMDTETGVLNITGTGAMTDYSSSLNSSTGRYETTAPWRSYISSIKTVNIGDSVTSIGEWAFYNCSSLTSVTIPDSVTSIGYAAFRDCSSLTSVNITDIAKWCEISFVTSDANPLYYAKKLYLNGTLLTDLVIPDSVTSIGYFAFRNCSSLTSITIPDSVTSIGGFAFSGCSSLTSVTIGDSVTSIGDSAFYNCSSLTGVTIPDSVTSIGSEAFCYCTSLTSVTIGDSVTSIGDYAFYNCSSLTSVIIGDSVTSIGNSAFNKCSSLTSVAIGDSVTSIGNYAFNKCSSLTSVTFVNFCGWMTTSSITATSGSRISPSTLMDASTAARYLKSSYYNYYWICDFEHSYSAVVTAPTCTEKGYTTYTCACGDSYVGDETEVLPHDYDGTVTAPTCTEKGYTTYVCPDCGDSYVGDETEVLPHDYDGTVTAPTCTAGGYTTYVCSVCEDSYVDAESKVAALGHSYEATVTAPTCTTEGYTTHVCSVCGDSYVDDRVAAFGHSYEATVTAPTCTAEGYTTYACSVCGYNYKSDYVAVIPHVYGDDKYCDACGGEMPKSVYSYGENGGFWYIWEDGELVIGGTSYIGDYTVNSAPWASIKNLVTKITVLDGIYYIGNYAFYGFGAVSEVVLPSTLVSVGEYSFAYATGIDSLMLPESLISIGRFAFHLSGAKAVNFGNTVGWTAGSASVSGGLTDSANAALYLTIAYSSVNWVRDSNAPSVPDQPETDGDLIVEGAFVWKLTKDGVLSITGKGAMPNYTVDELPWAEYKGWISRIEIGEGITSVGRCAFYGCASLREIVLPSTLTEIKEYAFYGCSELSEIAIPESVNAIGRFAFRRAGVTKVDFGVAYGWSAGENTFTATEVYGLGAGYLTKNYYKLNWVRDVNAEIEEINPNFVAGGACNTTVKWELSYVDEAKTQMKLIISGNGAMPEYGTGAAPWYEYVANIVEIEVSEGVTTVGRCAFYGLKFVTKVTLYEGLTKIGDYAFNGCRNLKDIDIPETVTAIGTDAFGKTGLTEVPNV